MASKLNRIGKDIMSAMKKATEHGTSAYDTTAEVRRIEGDIAWVHIAGGEDETPVKLTIAAKAGDSVQVRVGGGRAWITGNATAPPTDDRQANIATEKAEKADKKVSVVQKIADTARKIAGNTTQYFWHTQEGTDTGAHITEKPQEEFLADPQNGGGNLLARSNGIAVRDGLTELATFGSDSARIGDEGKAHVVINTSGQTVYAGNGTTQIAHLGYGDGKDGQGGTSTAPYYSLGRRKSGSAIGNYSTAEGSDTTASGYASHAEGNDTTASGHYSHAGGLGTMAGGWFQTVIGCYNKNKSNNLFEIGYGPDSTHRANVLEVDKNGNIIAAGGLTLNGNKPLIRILEEGTTGHWRYRKWSDGRYEAWYNSGQTTVTLTTSSGNGWYRNNNAYTISSPSFASTVHYVTVQAMVGYANVITSLVSANSSEITYYVSHLGSLSNVKAYITAYITGSW